MLSTATSTNSGFAPASALPAALDPWFLPQGNEGDDVLYATGDSNWLYVCPASTLPWHRSRPRFLPQGGGGADTLTATGSVLRLRGEGGAGDSCTLDGVTKTAGDGSKFAGCE